MDMHKGWAGFAVVVLMVIASGAIGADNKDVRAVERDAYIKAAGHDVAGIPDTAKVSSVDPLGDHRIALYTVDGSHKNVWLVTTDTACVEPMLLGDRIVSQGSDATVDCRSVAIQSVDRRALGAQLRSLLFRGGDVPADAMIDPASLRFSTLFHSEALTDGGRTR